MALDVYKDWLGIPDGPRPPGHYELLRLVRFEDDVTKIRANYKKLNGHVRKYATGQYSIESQDLLNELAKAMLCLTDPERKRELDESSGREFAEELSETGHKLLENVLVEQGNITKDQRKEAAEFADQRGLSMRDALVQMKYVDGDTAAQALAVELGLSYVELSEMVPEDSVLDIVPRSLVKRNRILPLFVDDDMLLVACVDEPTHELEDELRLRYGVPMRRVIATPRSIEQGIATYYAPGMRDEAATEYSEAEGAKASGAGKKGAAAKKLVRFSKLTDEERRQRKSLGIIIMCWATIGSLVLDQFVLKSILVPNWSNLFLLSFFVPPFAIWYVLKVYWK